MVDLRTFYVNLEVWITIFKNASEWIPTKVGQAVRQTLGYALGTTRKKVISDNISLWRQKVVTKWGCLVTTLKVVTIDSKQLSFQWQPLIVVTKLLRAMGLGRREFCDSDDLIKVVSNSTTFFDNFSLLSLFMFIDDQFLSIKL